MLMLITSYRAAKAADFIVPPAEQDMVKKYQQELLELNQPTLQQLQFYIQQIKILVNSLENRTKALAASRGAGTAGGSALSPKIIVKGGSSTVVAGSKAVPLAEVFADAKNSLADTALSSLTLTLEAPEDNSQKGISNCRFRDETKDITAGVHPLPSKSNDADVIFSFINPLTVPKGTSKTLTLTCDVTKDPQGPATYAWRLGTTSSAKTLLISSGSFVLEVASTTPAARGVKSGSKEEIAVVFELYAAGEAVELKELAMQINGNPRAVTAYSLWDGDTQVGGGTLSGDSVFKTVFTKPFVIPKDAHKLLTIKVDIAPVIEAGRVQTGDAFAVNYNGGDNNFVLTYGIGGSSGRGINPSIKTDTNTPEITLIGN